MSQTVGTYPVDAAACENGNASQAGGRNRNVAKERLEALRRGSGGGEKDAMFYVGLGVAGAVVVAAAWFFVAA